MLMNSYIYDFHEKIDLNRLLGPFLAAHEAIIRFDERLRRSHLREAFLNRLLFQEACAAQLAEGDLVHLEELLLFDRHLSRGQPSMALSSARQILRTWRQAGNANARDLLTSTRPGEDARPIMDGDSDIDDDSHLVRPDAGALAEWHRVRRASERLPPLIAAAVVWDTWLTLNPEPMGAWRAPLLAALTLRARGTTTSLLLPIDSGRRFARYRRHPNHVSAP